MKKLSHLLLLPIALLAITGCNNGKQKTDKEVVDEIANSPALLMHDADSTGSSNLIPGGTKFSIRDGYSYVGMFAHDVYKDAKFEWTFTPETNWTVGTYEGSGDYKLFTPKTDLYIKGDVDPSYDATLNLKVTYKSESAEVQWRAHYSANRIIQVSIPELRSQIKHKQANIGNVYETFGYVTGWFQNTPRVGLFIQDGEDAFCVYDDKKTGLPVAAVEAGLAQGDIVRVLGHYDITGGLTRFIPSEFEKVETAPFDMSAPVATEVTADNYSIAGLSGRDGTIATASGLVFKKVLDIGKKEVTDLTKLKPGTSFFFVFEKENTNSEKVEINFQCNTYIGKTAQQGFIDMVKDWEADVTTVDFSGMLYAVNNFPHLVGFETTCFSVL